ncbi:MAG: tetratricopeptide repeat protein, partial [Acidobacteriota bacterium]|nr:tetratricopeptide repeat protein [Acidobacteriota bacterium]
MASTNHSASVLLAVVVIFAAPVSAQDSGHAVHHRKVVEQTSAASADLSNAESAIEKKDYPLALQLLQKVVAATPNDYQAWFDLGFVKNAIGQPDESIAAYRRSVAIKPDVFESNLNLGLMLQKAGQPGAEQFLRAATGLKPTSHAEEGIERAWLSLGRLLETSRPGDAIEAYRKASALQPK